MGREGSDVAALLRRISYIDLVRFEVADGYFRFSDAERENLGAFGRRVRRLLAEVQPGRQNFVVWGDSSVGKSSMVAAFVRRASRLGVEHSFHECNLASGKGFANLDGWLRDSARVARLCFFDEIDAKRAPEFYDRVYPALDLNVDAPKSFVVVCAGSGVGGPARWRARVSRQDKGPDILTRLDPHNLVQIPPLTPGDRLLIVLGAMGSVFTAAGHAGTFSVNKATLYYLLADHAAPRELEARGKRVMRACTDPEYVSFDDCYRVDGEAVERFRIRNLTTVRSLLERHVTVSPLPTRSEGPARVRTVQAADARLLEILARTSNHLRIGSLATHCQFLPEHLWDEWYRRTDGGGSFVDYDEGNRIEMLLLPDAVLGVTIERLVQELRVARESAALTAKQRRAVEKVLTSLEIGGANAYPRLCAPPQVVEDPEGRDRRLRLVLAPSVYGAHLLNVYDVDIPSLRKVRDRCSLTSLGVRVSYTFPMDRQWRVAFHRRGVNNEDYAGAWDIGAAGYLDPVRHRPLQGLDPGTGSPYQAARNELAEELGLSMLSLPHPDNVSFFGIVRNTLQGTISLTGECRDESRKKPPPGPESQSKVAEVASCNLDPESVGEFIVEKRYWTPEAIVTAVLTLEAHGFPRPAIEQAFKDAGMTNGRVRLSPFVGGREATPPRDFHAYP